MIIGIQPSKDSFSDRWIDYCEKTHIHWNPVNCYKSNIIEQLSGCDALMWHFSQNSPKAILFAKQLIYSLETCGKKVFPNFHTCWHFDDKVGQKYLLETISAPLVSTWVFYNKNEAFEWAEKTGFPKVFKLRSGASSQNVRLVKTRQQAIKLISKSFGHGFPAYDPADSLKERWRLYRLDKTNFRDLLEGVARFAIPPPYAKVRGHERGYIYFQEFIADNDSDVRVIVIGDKAFAIKRMVRENDFRASGSGNILYDRSLFDENTIRLSFTMARKLKVQCVAFDFVYQGNQPLVVEISYGFSPAGYFSCPGYWDGEMNWHEGKFDPYGWMVENLISSIQYKT
jgi:glutathione synthase/RimK-type ligase-like ATP-grasp enzyme